jgi:hypothetical protein
MNDEGKVNNHTLPYPVPRTASSVFATGLDLP